MQHQRSHQQRVAALGRHYKPCRPSRNRCLRRINTPEFM